MEAMINKRKWRKDEERTAGPGPAEDPPADQERLMVEDPAETGPFGAPTMKYRDEEMDRIANDLEVAEASRDGVVKLRKRAEPRLPDAALVQIKNAAEEFRLRNEAMLKEFEEAAIQREAQAHTEHFKMEEIREAVNAALGHMEEWADEDHADHQNYAKQLGYLEAVIGAIHRKLAEGGFI